MSIDSDVIIVGAGLTGLLMAVGAAPGLPLGQPIPLTRFTSPARDAERVRDGRDLLAGDAAGSR